MSANNKPPYRADLDAINASAALAELRRVDRWVCWEPIQKGDRWRKVPKRPNGANADATKPISWFNFDKCAEAFAKSKKFAGVGFVLDGSVDLVGLDFDHCLDEFGEIADPELDDFIERLASYTEVSPSGTGLRCFLRGQMDRDSLTFRVGDVEGVAFKSKRYLTITGQRHGETPDSIERRQDHLDWIAEQSLRRHHDSNGTGRHRRGSLFDGADDAPHWFDALPEERQGQEVAAMLGHLTDPEFGEYEVWLRITFAVHHASDGKGFDLWDDWCKKLPGYDSDENAYKWTSIHSDRDHSVTVGTIIDLAKMNGYQLPPDAGRPQLSEGDRVRVEQFSAPPPQPPKCTHAGAGPQPSANPGAFIGPIGDIVRTYDLDTEADPWGVYASLITMYGNWLDRRVYVQVGADRHFPSLYTLLVGDSNVGRKGTAAGLAKLVMEALDAEWAANNFFRHVNSGQGIIQTVKNVDADARKGAAFIGDKRVMFVLSEFADLLAKTKMEGNTVFPTLRALWDDGCADNTSVTRPARVRDATVSVLGMVTARELCTAMSIEEMVTGTLNRFLVFAVERSKELTGHPPLLDHKPVSKQIAALRDNVDKARAGHLFGNVAPVPAKLSAAADQAVVALREEFEAPVRNWVDVALQRSYVQVLRVALVLAVSCGSREIDVTHLEAARLVVCRSNDSMKSLCPMVALTVSTARPRAVRRHTANGRPHHDLVAERSAVVALLLAPARPRAHGLRQPARASARFRRRGRQGQARALAEGAVQAGAPMPERGVGWSLSWV